MIKQWWWIHLELVIINNSNKLYRNSSLLIIIGKILRLYWNHLTIKWFMLANVEMINVLFNIYGNSNNMLQLKAQKTIKILIRNIFHFGNAKNASLIQLNIVRKDAFSRIGLNNISLNVQDKLLVLVIQFYYHRFKELRQVLHL